MKKVLTKIFISLHRFFYSLTGGKIGSQMGEYKILLLTTKGRKSGLARTKPLAYFDHEDGYLLIASNGGSDRHPAWYLNLKNDPLVAIQIKDQVIQAQAEILNDTKRAPIWQRIVEEAPQYGEYESRTDRLIPVVWLASVS